MLVQGGLYTAKRRVPARASRGSEVLVGYAVVSTSNNDSDEESVEMNPFLVVSF